MFPRHILFTFCMEQPWGKPLKKGAFSCLGATHSFTRCPLEVCWSQQSDLSLTLERLIAAQRPLDSVKLLSCVNLKFLLALKQNGMLDQVWRAFHSQPHYPKPSGAAETPSFWRGHLYGQKDKKDPPVMDKDLH